MLRSIPTTALAVGLLLLAPAVASGESYLVTSCQDPAGKQNAAAGWTSLSSSGGLVTNTCETAGGALLAALPEAKPQGNANALWRFDAPAGTRIVRVSGVRSTIGLAGITALPEDISYLLATDGGQVLEQCSPKSSGSSCADDLTGPVDKQGLNAGYIQFRALCLNAGLACSRPLAARATRMWVTLEDPIGPAVANADIDDGELSGTLRATFDAADVGGGLYRALVKVDGKVAQAVALGPAPCADVAPADLDPYQFDVPVPCPSVVKGATASLDVRSLAPGPHGVEIAVEDAAGNQRAVVGPVEFPKPNVASGSAAQRAAALTGRLRMWFVKSRTKARNRLSSRFGSRVVTRGVLRARNGRGIVGARVDVYHIRRDGKRRLVKTGLKSRAGGALTLILPNNVDTRTIEFAYRALRPGPITSRQRLRLTVRKRTGQIYHRRSAGRR